MIDEERIKDQCQWRWCRNESGCTYYTVGICDDHIGPAVNTPKSKLPSKVKTPARALLRDAIEQAEARKPRKRKRKRLRLEEPKQRKRQRIRLEL